MNDGASLCDRAGLATPQARSGLGHSETIPSAMDTLGQYCMNCRFYQEIEAERQRYVGLRGFVFKRPAYEPENFMLRQCFRHPVEVGTNDDHWCGEYEPTAQGIETGTDETRSGSVSEADESPVACDAPNASHPTQEDRSDGN